MSGFSHHPSEQAYRWLRHHWCVCCVCVYVSDSLLLCVGLMLCVDVCGLDYHSFNHIIRFSSPLIQFARGPSLLFSAFFSMDVGVGDWFVERILAMGFPRPVVTSS